VTVYVKRPDISFTSFTEASAVHTGHQHTLMTKHYIMALTRNPKTRSSCCALHNSEPTVLYEEGYIKTLKAAPVV